MKDGTRTARRGEERGFTLMEMLIALLLAAVILAPLYIITRGMAEQTTVRQMETEAMQRARVGLETLVGDFQRTGMLVSPSPSQDKDSIVSKSGVSDTQMAYSRQAVVHLNKTDGAFDTVMIVGSFLSGLTYTGYVGVDGPDTVRINETFPFRADCESEFSPSYAFAHLFNSGGQTLDAKIAQAQCDADTDCTCTVTLESGELFGTGPTGFPDGQLISVAANQAALYTVETVAQGGGGSHQALVRYLVDYSAELGLQADCTPADLDEMIEAARPTARIIAEYVEEFQVWFRPIYVAADGEDPRPVYHAMDGVTEDTGFAPPRQSILIGVATPDAFVQEDTDLGCAPADDTQLGPQHLRSALIRLAVRSERTDQSIRIAPPGDPDSIWDSVSGVTAYNIAKGPDTDVGAYKLRTVITEVPMPNLASKVATFNTVPQWQN